MKAHWNAYQRLHYNWCHSRVYTLKNMRIGQWPTLWWQHCTYPDIGSFYFEPSVVKGGQQWWQQTRESGFSGDITGSTPPPCFENQPRAEHISIFFLIRECWDVVHVCWWGSDARTVKRIYRWVGGQVSCVHHNETVCSQVCSNSGQCLLCCVLEKKLQQPVLKDTVMSIHNTHDGQEGRDQ